MATGKWSMIILGDIFSEKNIFAQNFNEKKSALKNTSHICEKVYFHSNFIEKKKILSTPQKNPKKLSILSYRLLTDHKPGKNFKMTQGGEIAQSLVSLSSSGRSGFMPNSIHLSQKGGILSLSY